MLVITFTTELSEMSESKWHVSDYAKNRLRFAPRDKQSTVLIGLDLECREPLSSAAWERVVADISARLRESLPQHPDGSVRRWVALKMKMEQLQRQKRESELKIEELRARRQRLVLCGLTPTQPAELAQVDAELRGLTHTVGNVSGMIHAVEQEATQARAAAERVLSTELDRERMAALERYQRERDEALAELFRVAGPALEKLASAVDAIKHSVSMGMQTLVLFRPILDKLTLPEGSSPDAAPAPPAPSPAPSAPPQTAALGHLPGSITLPAELRGSVTLTPPQLQASEPTAPPAAPPAPPPPASEGKRKRATAKAD
jgi:hypothetical protein